MGVERGFSSERFFIVMLPCERENSTGIVFKQIKQMPPSRKDTGTFRRKNTGMISRKSIGMMSRMVSRGFGLS